MTDATAVMLNQIVKCLDQYGIRSGIRDDRVDGPYIDIGDYRRRSRRAQFWAGPEKCLVKVWVGINMGTMYGVASESKYLAKSNTDETKEIHLILPYLYPSMEFIRAVGEA